jgi:two-component system, OmpR family, response regulator
MRLLLVEDDEILSDGICEALRASFVVDHCQSVAQAVLAVDQVEYDTVLLDLGLRDGDGLQLLAKLRSSGSFVPVLIITARDTLEDRVRGLDSGADDYLTKPFGLPELEARVRALIRRRYFSAQAEVAVGNLRFDTVGRRVYVDDVAVDLSARESALLELLLLNLGRLVSKDQIIEKLSTSTDDIGPNAVEVYMHRLRKKIAAVGFEFRTLRGLGYMVQKTS